MEWLRVCTAFTCPLVTSQRREVKELRLGIFSPFIVRIWNLVALKKYFMNFVPLLLLRTINCKACASKVTRLKICSKMHKFKMII